MSMTSDEILLISKSVQFAFSQDDDFKKMYIENFVIETCNAYPGSGTGRISCSKGVKERFILGIANAVDASCKDADCNDTYKALDALLNNKFVIADKVSGWFNNADNRTFIQGMNNTKLKKKICDDLIAEARTLGSDTQTLKSDINNYLDVVEQAGTFDDYRGGRKLRRTRKSKKRGKSKKSKKSRKSKKRGKSIRK